MRVPFPSVFILPCPPWSTILRPSRYQTTSTLITPPPASFSPAEAEAEDVVAPCRPIVGVAWHGKTAVAPNGTVRFLGPSTITGGGRSASEGATESEAGDLAEPAGPIAQQTHSPLSSSLVEVISSMPSELTVTRDNEPVRFLLDVLVLKYTSFCVQESQRKIENRNKKIVLYKIVEYCHPPI
jgi:hypothetical protein